MRILSDIYWFFLWWDLFLVARVMDAVEWLEGWLSFSQKRIEQTIWLASIGASVVACFYICSRLPSMLPLCAIFIPYMAWLQYRQLRMPASVRLMRLFSRRGVFNRLFWQIWIVTFLLPPHHSWRTDIAFTVWYGLGCLFDYVTVISSDGQRGKRRKLALEKLKELFGTAWIPQPVGSQ